MGVVLDAMESPLRRLNDYLVLLHVSAGLALLAFSVDDVLNGGPARPLIVPILGAYMSAGVVFYTVLKEKSPTLLLWTNGLGDILLLIAAQRLVYISFGDLGTDLTVALLIAVVMMVYGSGGLARLSAAMGAIVAVFFGFTLFGRGYPVVDAGTAASMVIVVAAVAGGIWLARSMRRRDLAGTIRRLERLDTAVAVHRIGAAAGPTPR